MGGRGARERASRGHRGAPSVTRGSGRCQRRMRSGRGVRGQPQRAFMCRARLPEGLRRRAIARRERSASGQRAQPSEGVTLSLWRSASPRLWDASLEAFAPADGCRIVTTDSAYQQFSGSTCCSWARTPLRQPLTSARTPHWPRAAGSRRDLRVSSADRRTLATTGGRHRPPGQGEGDPSASSSGSIGKARRAPGPAAGHRARVDSECAAHGSMEMKAQGRSGRRTLRCRAS